MDRRFDQLLQSRRSNNQGQILRKYTQVPKRSSILNEPEFLEQQSDEDKHAEKPAIPKLQRDTFMNEQPKEMFLNNILENIEYQGSDSSEEENSSQSAAKNDESQRREESADKVGVNAQARQITREVHEQVCQDDIQSSQSFLI